MKKQILTITTTIIIISFSAYATPVNDNFSDAILLPGNSGSITGNNENATNEIGEPAHASKGPYKSVWWKLNPSTDGFLNIDTHGSDFDTVLAIYIGDAISNLASIASNDDDGSINNNSGLNKVTLLNGRIYYIAVAGFSSNSFGSISLNYTLDTSIPENDEFSNAITISGNSGTLTGYNLNTTTENEEPDHAGRGPYNSVWYKFTPLSNGWLDLNTHGSSFDTVLAVYSGDNVNNLTEVASNDDDGSSNHNSGLTGLLLEAGKTYYIAIAGYSSTSKGNITLNWKLYVKTYIMENANNLKFNWRIPLNTNNWYFNGPFGVAVGQNENVYVADTYHHRIQILSPNGEVLGLFGGFGRGDHGQFRLPFDLAAAQNGELYVADTYNNRIQVFDEDGNYLREWGARGTSSGYFKRPMGIGLDSQNRVYVADTDNHRIQVFTTNGTFITTWGVEGTNLLEFISPLDVAVSDSGNIFIVDNGNSRIQVLTDTGNFVTNWGSEGTGTNQFLNPHRVALDNNNVYVTDSTNYCVKVFTQTGQFKYLWGSKGSENNQFNGPAGIDISENGKVFISDVDNWRIQVFYTNGNHIATWNSAGNEQGEFNRPAVIAIDSDNELFVTDLFNNRVQVLDYEGNYLRSWGSYGSGDSQFHYPTGIAFDNSGNVYVADSMNGRIQVFNNDGTYIKNYQIIFSLSLPFPYYTAFAPSGIAIYDDKIYISDVLNHRVLVLTTDGSYVTQWGVKGSQTGNFVQPLGISVSDDGSVYVADTYNHRVQVFTSSGAYLRKIGSYGSGAGQFIFPHVIAFGTNDILYISDSWMTAQPGNSGNMGGTVVDHVNRIQIFSKEGNYIGQYGSSGSANGQLTLPIGIAIKNKDLFVCDTGNSRIIKLTQTTIPTTPGNFTAYGYAGNVDLSWSVANNADGYILSRDGVTIAELAASGTNFTDFSAVNDVVNHYSILATNQNSKGFAAETSAVLPDSFDSGDDTATGAMLIAPTKAYNSHGVHTLGHTDAEDWFRISMTAGGVYYFDSIGSEGNIRAELYDGPGTSFNKVAEDNDSGWNGQFALQYAPVSDGEYYLRLIPESDLEVWAGNLNYHATGSGNIPPTASVNFAITNLSGFGSATFSGSGYDPESQPLQYNWTEDGSNPDINKLPIRNFANVTTFPLRKPGEYKFYLTVNDGEWNSTPTMITVNVPGISGKILCEGFSSHVPLWGVKVEITNSLNHLSEYLMSETDVKGNYVIDSGSGIRPVLDVRRNTTPKDVLISEQIPVEGLHYKGIRYTPLNFDINGRIIDNNSANGIEAAISILLRSGTEILVPSDSLGKYHFTQVPETWADSIQTLYPHLIRVQANGYKSAVGQWNIRGSQFATNYLTGYNFELTPDTQKVNISGNVYSASNFPISNANVDFGLWKTTTSSDGSFTISNIQRGDYFINISALGYDDYVTPDIKKTSGSSWEFFLEGGDVLIQGMVTDENGHIIENATVSVHTPGFSETHAQVQTDNAGFYQLIVGKGYRKIHVSAPGYDDGVDVYHNVTRPNNINIPLIPEPMGIWIIGLMLFWTIGRKPSCI